MSAAANVVAALGLVWAWPEHLIDHPGAALARLRSEAGVSQREMAKRIGVTHPTILSLEKRFRGSQSTLLSFLRCLGQQGHVRDPSVPRRRLIPKPNTPQRDIVMTPEALAVSIMAQFGGELRGVVLDPCRGNGAFFNTFPSTVEREWCEIAQGRDFFGWTRKVDWLVTNPPFSKMRAFLVHAMEVSDNVVFLAPLSHFTTRARIRDIRSAGFGLKRIITVPTPSDWPASGFQLTVVHLKRGWRGTIEMSDLDASATRWPSADLTDCAGVALVA
ncbi:helix-turn-helix transcriptional regulator [Pelagibacterium flavum]|uniref:Helix-turn-helix transcriptional regulator n=1 Tax=Pelagibacterium flavum TaxID=2984530 RepID=A0ABY6IWA4_9HYPH|nr:helix-turn-helix transcriptional regulator [Pelagibacterium sp. YIM 151497]UYQ73470.1 helix-turn-helix transcriptional regulator [Pelagibacterium sp. YIM 151497]